MKFEQSSPGDSFGFSVSEAKRLADSTLEYDDVDKGDQYNDERSLQYQVKIPMELDKLQHLDQSIIPITDIPLINWNICLR